MAMTWVGHFQKRVGVHGATTGKSNIQLPKSNMQIKKVLAVQVALQMR